MVFQSKWKCRQGTILGVLKCSNLASSKIQLIAVPLADFKDSTLGNVTFRRLCPPEAASGYCGPQNTTSRSPPAFLVLPPPPAKALPHVDDNKLVSSGVARENPSILYTSVQRKPPWAHALQYTTLVTWFSSRTALCLVELYCITFYRLRVATLWIIRALLWVFQTLGIAEPPLRPGLTRVRWRCVCQSSPVDLSTRRSLG